MTIIKLFLCFIMWGLLSTAYGLRCQGSLVFEGDTKYIVERKCGEPLAKDLFDDPAIIFNEFNEPIGEVSDVYERWTYQQSPNDFIYEVLFKNGRVKTINANRAF